MASLVPKHTCLGALNPVHLRVLSYNLLAPIYVRPLDLRTGQVQAFAAFLWAEPADQVLAWDARWPRLRKELEDSKADVICLQEVQFDVSSEPEQTDLTAAKPPAFSLPRFLQLEGYDWRLPSLDEMIEMAERNKRVLGKYAAIGNAVLWRQDRLQLSALDKESKHQSTRVSVCLEPESGSALACIPRPCAFTSIHLDATDEGKRVKQLTQAVTISKEVYGCADLIICGDMNTDFASGTAVARFDSLAAEPSSEQLEAECCAALRLDVATDEGGKAGGEEAPSAAGEDATATVKPSPEQLQQWQALHAEAQAVVRERRVRLERAPTGPTRASYAHGATAGPCVSFKLDHFLYAGDGLRLSTLWETLEADPASAEAGLPNAQCPSDHLPIAAAFERIEPLGVSEARVAELQAAVAAAESGQAEALAVLVAQMDEEQAQAVGRGGEAGGGEEGELQGKGKGKGKGRPSPEMVALLQRRRKLEKELKGRQREERAALLENLSVRELEVVDRMVGSSAGGGALLRKAVKGQAPATVWVEHGPASQYK